MSAIAEQMRPYQAESNIQSTFPQPDYVADYYSQDELPSLQVDLQTESIKTTKQEEFTQSIYESYNAFNEAERIQKLQHLTSEEQAYYISENIISYLEEFVGEIRIKKLAGVLRDDGSMEMLGTNVTDMYNNAAWLAGPTSREYAEKLGLDAIVQQINKGNNRAIWISPPKLADYGFAFTFMVDDYDDRLGGRPFREMLLRYDEDLESLETSRLVHSSLVNRIGVEAPSSNSFASHTDFLAHPLVYSHDDFKDIEALYQYLNISPEDVRKSEEFRLQVSPIIDQYIKQYTALIQEMSQYDLSHPDTDFRMLEKDANDIIGAIFNIARIIHRRMNSDYSSYDKAEQDIRTLSMLSGPIDMMEMARHMAQYEELVISGGSNCAVTERSAGLLEQDVIGSMNSGLSFGDSMQAIDLKSTSKKDKMDCVNCPNCKQLVNAILTKTTISCPKCKHTVKRS